MIQIQTHILAVLHKATGKCDKSGGVDQSLRIEKQDTFPFLGKSLTLTPPKTGSLDAKKNPLVEQGKIRWYSTGIR
jgi:hypothetical protein